MRPDWRPGNQRPSREKVGPVAAPNARRWVKAILHRPPATEPTNWLSKRVLPFSPFSFSFFLSFYFFGSLGFFFSSCSFSTPPLETRNSKRTFSRRPRQTGLAAGIRTVLFAFFFLFFFLFFFGFGFTGLPGFSGREMELLVFDSAGGLAIFVCLFFYFYFGTTVAGRLCRTLADFLSQTKRVDWPCDRPED